MTNTTRRFKQFRYGTVSKIGLLLTISTGIAACGDDGTGSSARFPGEVPPPCDVARQSFVIDRLEMPLVPTGQLNGARYGLASLFEADNTDALARVVSSGGLTWVVHVETCEDYARVILEDDAGRETRIPAVGTVDGDHVVVADGTALVPAPMFFRLQPSDGEIWIPAAGVALDLTIDGDRISGSLDVGVSALPEDLGEIMAAVAASASEIYAADRGCPARCTTETGRRIALGDEDGDGEITAEEVVDSWIAANFFAADLDLMVDPEAYIPGQDGVDDHLSLELTFEASRL